MTRADYLEKLAREQGVFVRRDGDKLVVKGPIKKTPEDERALSQLSGAPPEPPAPPPMDWAEADLRAHEPTEDHPEAIGIMVGPVTQSISLGCEIDEGWVGQYFADCMTQMQELAEAILPAGSVYEIRAKMTQRGAYKLTWVLSPWFAREPITGPLPWPGKEREGHMVLGLFKVPERTP